MILYSNYVSTVLLTILLQQAVLPKHLAKACNKQQLIYKGFWSVYSPHNLKLSFHVGELVFCFVEEINMLSTRPFSSQTFTLSCSTRGFLWLRLCRIVKMHIGLTAVRPSSDRYKDQGWLPMLRVYWYFYLYCPSAEEYGQNWLQQNTRCQCKNTCSALLCIKPWPVIILPLQWSLRSQLCIVT